MENVPHRHSPYVNYCLLGLNFMVFAWELSLGSSLPEATVILGFVPARFVSYFLNAQTTFSQAVLPLFSSLFLHGSGLHLMPNMLFLYIFGNKAEDTLGHARYLLLYLAGGVGANLIYLMFSPSSTVALIGASGAIAAVMGGYFTLFPEMKFSKVFITIWILAQFVYALFASLTRVAGQTGMAWWAHVGGFALGLALIRLLAPIRLPIALQGQPEHKPEN